MHITIIPFQKYLSYVVPRAPVHIGLRCHVIRTNIEVCEGYISLLWKLMGQLKIHGYHHTRQPHQLRTCSLGAIESSTKPSIAKLL
jgi:hypothetical protein